MWSVEAFGQLLAAAGGPLPTGETSGKVVSAVPVGSGGPLPSINFTVEARRRLVRAIIFSLIYVCFIECLDAMTLADTKAYLATRLASVADSAILK